MARILVVDDDQPIRELVKECLEKLGHQVIEAGDGAVAIIAFKQQPFDLIITDIYMPEADGISLLRELRKQRHNAKVIAVSGGSTLVKKDFLDTAMQLGAVAAIYKPFSLDQLQQEVSRALGGMVTNPSSPRV
jgi:CheY-like chemotaxis protein